MHKLILSVYQILESHEIKNHAHFLTTPTQKLLKQLLALLNLHQHPKNRLFYLFILEIQPIIESSDTGHTHL